MNDIQKLGYGVALAAALAVLGGCGGVRRPTARDGASAGQRQRLHRTGSSTT